MEVSPAGLVSFVPLLIYSLAFGLTSFLLAKNKGQNVVVWTILGLIPLVNMFCIGYFIGSSSKVTDDKLDKILARLEANS